MGRAARAWMMAWVVVVVGCGPDGGADVRWTLGVAEQPDACTPDPERYASQVRTILSRRCGACHDAPQFGAPFGLLTYAEVIAGAAGMRPVDRMLPALAEGRMPPARAEPLTPDEFDSLVAWASCDSMQLPYPEPAEASRPEFVAAGPAPQGTERIELRADGYSLDDQVDVYGNFPFATVVDGDRFVRRFEVIIDERRVVHHVVLRRTNPDRPAHLYVWTPGTDPIQFPGGGLRIGPQDAFVLEVHYSNYHGLTGIRDRSGVALFVGPPAGTEYAMFGPSAEDIVVEPHATATVSGTCTAGSDFLMLAGMPHMHGTGDSFRSELIHPDGSRQTVLSLSAWSFDQQAFYALGTQVRAGDAMVQTCNYVNPRDTRVVGGPNTTDEMCIHFIYVTPPRPQIHCELPPEVPRP